LQIGLAEIFAHLGVARIDRQRLVIVIDALVDIAELAGRVADRAEHPRLLAVLDAEEEFQRLCIMPLLAEIAPGKIEVVIGERRRVAVEASVGAAAPDLPGAATCLDAAALLLAVPRSLGTTLRLAAFRAAAHVVHVLDGEGLRYRKGQPKQN